MNILIKKFPYLLLLLLALAVGWLGLLLPIRFQTVSTHVLKAAAQGTDTVLDRGWQFAGFDKTGPALFFAQAAQSLELNPSALKGSLAALEETFPDYRISGGPEPFYDQFLALLDSDVKAGSNRSSVSDLLVARKNRQSLLAFLQGSRNVIVAEILKTRGLTSVTQFMPVNTGAGAPLDAAILTTALLEQAGFFQTEFQLFLKAQAESALGGSDEAVAQLEAFYSSILGLSKRMNWLQLGAWCRMFDQVSDFNQSVSFMRKHPERLSLFYSAVLLSQQSEAVIDYLHALGDPAWESMLVALKAGEGALALLLSKQQTVYAMPPYLLFLDKKEAWASRLSEFCFNHETLSKGLMLLAYGGAGFLLSLALKGLFSAASRASSPSRKPGLIFLTHSATGIFAVILLVLMAEPYLLEQKVAEPGNLFLEFEFIPQANIIDETIMPEVTIDKITILVLLVFLLSQLVIYTLCLLKLGQVKKMEEPPELKLKLLDNEEALFDCGLYIGLTGTVISLLMLAMGIVQASLVAAYASTLFGIIFVAVFKIIHLRPYKRTLIVESE